MLSDAVRGYGDSRCCVPSRRHPRVETGHTVRFELIEQIREALDEHNCARSNSERTPAN
jgi:hypothetical protein